MLEIHMQGENKLQRQETFASSRKMVEIIHEEDWPSECVEIKSIYLCLETSGLFGF